MVDSKQREEKRRTDLQKHTSSDLLSLVKPISKMVSTTSQNVISICHREFNTMSLLGTFHIQAMTQKHEGYITLFSSSHSLQVKNSLYLVSIVEVTNVVSFSPQWQNMWMLR